MKKFKNFPAICMLLAGFISSVIMITHQYEIKDFLWNLVIVMASFLIVGKLFQNILDKVFRKEEAKKEEWKRLEEEAAKEREAAASEGTSEEAEEQGAQKE